MERKLAAILAADIVGYSRLVQQDEESTVLRVKTLFQGFINKTIQSHDGNVIKTMGMDSWPSSPVRSRRCNVPSRFSGTLNIKIQNHRMRIR